MPSRLLFQLASFLSIVVAIYAGSRALVRALPGDPLTTLIAETGTNVSPETLRQELGLDVSLAQAVHRDLGKALHGDWGTSILSREPISPVLARRALRTLALATLSLLVGLLISMPLGLLAADKGGKVDRLCSWHGALAASLPTPWIGPVLLYLFAVQIPVVPAGNHIVLPALTIAYGFSGLWARLIRERVRETLASPAAIAARARGLGPWTVRIKYGLAPAAGSLVAYLGSQFGGLMAGSLVAETVFSWPGLGTYLVDAVLKRDYPVIEAATFVTAFFCLLGNRAGDWLQRVIDPRQEVRLG